MQPAGELTFEDKLLYYAAVGLFILLAGAIFGLVRCWKPKARYAKFLRVLSGNVLTCLCLCTLLFLVLEFYYRYLYDATDSFAMTRTTARWFYRHYFVNNAEVRDDENYFSKRRPELERRISFIGDSFTVGHGVPEVEDRFANRVRAAHIDEWEIHVWADAGRDTGAEIELVKRLAERGFEFDTVVLVYCLNDISDIVPEQLRIAERVAQAEPERNFLCANSFLINTYYFRLKARLNPEVTGYYTHLRSAYEGHLWNEQRQRLDRFREACDAVGGRLLVVTFPFLHAMGDNYEFRAAHQKLRDFWSERSVPHLDLLDLFEQHRDETLTVNRYDAHPNERAHALAADAILEFLETNL
jgi:lysophospholipase L1-like esterase